MPLMTYNTCALLETCIRPCRHLGVHPLKISKKRTAFLVDSKLLKIKFIFNHYMTPVITLVLVYFCWCAKGLYEQGKLSPTVWIGCVGLVCSSLFGIAIDYNVWRHDTDYAFLLNWYGRLLDYIDQTVTNTKEQLDLDNNAEKTTQRFLKGLLYFYYICNIGMLFIPFIFWQDFWGLWKIGISGPVTAFRGKPTPLPLAILLFLTIGLGGYVYFYTMIFARILVMASVAAVIGFFTLATLNNIRFQWELSKEMMSLTNPATGIQIYQEVFLILKQFNYISSYTIAAAKIIFLCLTCISFFFGLEPRIQLVLRILAIGVATFMTFMMGIVLKGTGKVKVQSTAIIEEWKTFEQRRMDGFGAQMDFQEANFLNNKIRSLQPISITVGDAYEIDEKSLLEYLGNIVDKTVVLLFGF